ncbi:hypothetical protein AGRO_4489 [Agrobacterium sp. ATCC 31749]|nr:hypothetical protein AGRO_4489 [Agrobacterium sp. ATCC 31749]
MHTHAELLLREDPHPTADKALLISGLPFKKFQTAADA